MSASPRSADFTPALNPPRRLLSLDALRGFDMFIIAGGEWIVEVLYKLAEKTQEGPFKQTLTLLHTQLSHVAWEGFRFYDLIFPLFVFMTGVSLVYSLSRIQTEGGRGAAMRRLIVRGLLMYLIGLWYYGGVEKGWEHIRLMGVLQRIAIAYTFGGLLFLTFRPRTLFVILVAILVGYWAMLTYIPVPEFGAGKYAEGQNFANYIDKVALPLRKWDGDHDPEGLLSNLTAVASCLLGVFAGLLMRNQQRSEIQKVLILLVAGAAMIAGGYYWGFSHPIIKKIWTSSFVLMAGGWSCVLLAFVHLLTEVIGLRFWAWPFVWIGVNPLAVYLSGEFVSWGELAKRIVGGPVAAACGDYGDLLVTMTAVLLLFLFARFLYVRKVYIRL